MQQQYYRALEMMGKPSFADIMSEVTELWEDRSLEELSDVVHSVCRYAGLPKAVSWHLARPTALKHVERMQERGCPRSEKNCIAAGESCCCKK